MENYIFYHECPYSGLTLAIALLPVNCNELNRTRWNNKFIQKTFSLINQISFSVPKITTTSTSHFLPPTIQPRLRLTETARLLVRTNVRRVFGTGGTSRSHSAEKREMELKRKYWEMITTDCIFHSQISSQKLAKRALHSTARSLSIWFELITRVCHFFEFD